VNSDTLFYGVTSSITRYLYTVLTPYNILSVKTSKHSAVGITYLQKLSWSI